MKKNQEQELPAWLFQKEEYMARTDREGFLEKSLLRILAMLSGFRRQASLSSCHGSVTCRLLLTILLILLSSLSRNALYLYCMLAAFLLRAALLPLRMLRRIMSAALIAGVFSMLLMLPAVFLGSPRSMLTLGLKVFFSTGLLGILSETTAWNRIAAALRTLRLPSVFILTFELTLRSIVQLGDIAGAMLTAMSLRSVGRNLQKHRTFSGIPGMAFLRAREISEQTYEAMQCRCFDGEYRTLVGERLRLQDLLTLVLGAAAVILFLAVH